MRTSHPPAVATWLLEHLRSGRANESITGDLIEEYRHGRSRLWYWWQVLVAILVSFWKEVRRHPVLVIRGVATGWALWLVYELGPALLVSRLVGTWRFEFPLVFGYPFGFGWWVIWLSVRAFSGWAVAKVSGAHATETVLAFAVTVLLWKFQLLPWTFHLFLEPIDETRYLRQLVANLMSMVLPSIFIVLGGVAAIPLKRERSFQKTQMAI